jgi:hypothetical protein
MGGFMGVPGSNPGGPISRYSGEVVLSEEVPEGWWGNWVPERATESLQKMGLEVKVAPFSSFFLPLKEEGLNFSPTSL